MHNETTDVDLV